MTDRPAGASASPSTGTHPLSEKALLAKKIREYNRRTTPVHQIHIKHVSSHCWFIKHEVISHVEFSPLLFNYHSY